MIALLREDWLKDPNLRKWNSVSCTENNNCNCDTDEHHIELWEHDSCVRGRIDTIVCTKCDSIKTFNIIR